MSIFDKRLHEYYRNTFKIAWPCIIETLLLSLVSIVSAIMVGNLGAEATAAVGVNQPVSWLMNSLAAGTAVGGTVLVAMYCGAEELSKAKNVARQAVAASFLFGIVVMCIFVYLSDYIPAWIGAKPEILPDARLYLKILSLSLAFHFAGFACSGILRGAGYTRLPMFNAVLVNIVNIVGNLFLIYPTRTITFISTDITVYGAGLGVKGSAIAACFAQCFSGIVLIIFLFNKNLKVHLSYKKSFRLQKRTIANILRIGLPTAGERVSINMGMILFQSIVANLGTISVSAHFLANIIESVSYMPAEGFAMAATTLVGQSLGAKKKEDALIYSRITLYAAVFCGFICCLIFLFIPHVLFDLFSNDPAVIEKGSNALRVMSVIQPFLCAAIVTTGILRGAGDTKAPLYTSIAGMWCVRQAAAWFFAYHLGLGLTGAWIGMALDIMVRFTLMHIRYIRKKWMYVSVRMD